MKILSTYLRTFLLAMVFLGTSCSSSFLELKNPQALPLRGTIKDLATLTTASEGVYAQFKGTDYYNRTFILLPDLLGDNVFISRSNTGKYLDHDIFAVTNDNGYVLGAWAAMYRVIVNANMAISEGEALAASDNATKQIIGELYAARALAYFDLVRMFAQPYNFTADASHLGVPIVTEPNFEIISPPRSTVKEVYDQIISDLQHALSLLNTAQKPAHFTPTAANALLAKVYLYTADWSNAEKYATDAISGPYSLLTTTNYVGSWNANFSVESLLEIANLATDNAGVNSISYLYEQAGYGEALATADLYETYTATDIRRQLINVGVRNVTFENPAYFVKKYPKGGSTNDDNIKVLRLSEVYLIRAEARAELGKTDASKNALAQQDLNMIVQRADTEAEEVTLTGDALVERILLERRKELAFEGNRFFDLTRRKKDVNHIRSLEEVVYTYPNEKFVMPIPIAETNANDNIIQNPGWTQ
ncbi:RagB/SusD family nutrient uptake outer membrane protein [Sphingobacterium phlebotomi]|uniref:RagB/SusD family nutrient uptake outer membrane protein n=1 Tax=Sphingobacterium phlebotomi TaxID=2605433 RepID=A0A5D4GWK7_9SPHI|nr:RagB/SusD family nutrient uptake outer membrane protein [Sphingobacterium phlebotomi]TYR32239.1 RagB/SusD family nutrient uptake outer membrane protein [Sphingobacterium phlebotomi]